MPTIFFEDALYQMRSHENVLDALIRGGASVPFACRRGTCQTCMMQVIKGDPGEAGTRALSIGAIAAGMFLPCLAHPDQDLTIAAPDLSQLYVTLRLANKEDLSTSTCKLDFEPKIKIAWTPGQFVNLRRKDGTIRSYSIASSSEEGPLLSIHVKRIENGTMSNWLCDELPIGELISGQGPQGSCYYEEENKERNLLMLGTGPGLSPIYSICRDALRRGHTGKIVLYHGSRTIDGLYLRDELEALAKAYPNFEYQACLTLEPTLPVGVARGRITDHAFAAHPDLEGWLVYLCGIPDMVYEARYRSILANVKRQDIKADPFEYAHHYLPDDNAKSIAIEPDPELWEALERGPGLTRILTAFYEEAYQDPRLAKLFRHTAKAEAIAEQYEVLAACFSGQTTTYAGLSPYNTHQSMIISDELFDHREEMLERHMLDCGLSEPLIRRWTAMHELFRREIVKSSGRGGRTFPSQ